MSIPLPDPMNPRDTRAAIARGELVLDRKVPLPPPEWGEFRRERMIPAIKAAIYFCNGRTLYQVRAYVKLPHYLSRQRIQQYVDKGVKFLWDRGCFRATTPT